MEGDYQSLKCRVGDMEEKNGRLEAEIRRLKDEAELSGGEIKKLEVEKARREDEICELRRRNVELVTSLKPFVHRVDVGGGSGESSGLCQVMVENEILKCEKRMADNEVRGLKEKIFELEARVAQLEDGVVKNGVAVRTSCGDVKAVVDEEVIDLNIPISAGPCVEEGSPLSTKDGLAGTLNLKTPVTPNSRRGNSLCKSKSDSLDGYATRRKLVYNHEEAASPTMSPILPAGVKSSAEGVIAISDSDGDKNTAQHDIYMDAAVNFAHFNVCFDDDDEGGASVSGGLKRPFVESSSDEHLDGIKESATPKRKRVLNVVASDSESDEIPIGMLLKKSLGNLELYNSSEDEVDTILANATQPSVMPRRRLISHSQLCGTNGKGSSRPVERSSSKHITGVHCSKDDVSADGMEDFEFESESEGESLGGFIVKSSDSNSCNSSVNDYSSGGNGGPNGSQLQSDSDVKYGEIMSRLRRDKDHKMKWKLEGEMLAAFGKDPELCMKAVCTLYRQQTSDEKQCKGTLHTNGRGFNQIDALRGSKLAEFLTDGNLYGDVKKSVEELEKYYPNGVEVCRDLAKRYSKQLFTIYQNKEDPLFAL
ncbi:unnamed protein product [Rhodiola kirilowii]